MPEILQFSALCPACGAQVPFRSAASVMAVCEYCQTTVLRDADGVRDQGKMAAVLADYSPLQIGSSGVWQGVAFALIGRIQLQYPDGVWNEWYVQCDDGSNAWLSDASGQYVFSRSAGIFAQAPAFDSLKINQLVFYDQARFQVTDLRQATCSSGAGELPFVVGQGWPLRVADLREGSRFVTFDYSGAGAVNVDDGGIDGRVDGANGNSHPEVFVGQAVTLEQLNMQLLRDSSAISASAGAIRGQMQQLDCPNCGSSVPYVAGVAEHLLCPACRAEVALTGQKAEVLATHQALFSLKTALNLGDQADIDGQKYSIIGLLQQQEINSDDPTASSTWIEYLLYSLDAGFLWLVDAGAEGWQKVRVLNELPSQKQGDVEWQGQRFNLQWRYQAEVRYAVGAFNWRVKIGDRTQLADYQPTNEKRGQTTLCAEQNAQEQTWSLAVAVSLMQVQQWFNTRLLTPPLPATASTASTAALPKAKPNGIFKVITVLLWLINLPLVLFGSGSLLLLLIATLILWVLSRAQAA